MLKLTSHMLPLLGFACIASAIPMPLYAQITLDPEREVLPAPEPVLPEALGPDTDSEAKPTPDIPLSEDAPFLDPPDYSKLSATEERRLRLDRLFERLSAAKDEEQADLIAEEIWAMWLESGSASINFILRRGTAAQTKGDMSLARRMFDQTTFLLPDFAEGWARSSRLALEEKNLSRALTEAAKTLTLEPRHFYALWTMGNIFEQLGRTEEALEAYREAHKLHPQLQAVKERLDALENAINGDVL